MCECYDKCYALPYDNPILTGRAKVVMRFVITQLIFYTIFFIFDLITITRTFPSILGAIILLSIAGCGCYGTKKPNKGSLGCYSWWNCVIGSLQIVLVVILTIGFGFVGGYRDYCYDFNGSHSCYQITIGQYAMFYVIFNVFFIPITIFYFFAFNKSQVLLRDVEFLHECSVTNSAIRLSPPNNAHIQGEQHYDFPPPPPPPQHYDMYQPRPIIIYEYPPNFQPSSNPNPNQHPIQNQYIYSYPYQYPPFSPHVAAVNHIEDPSNIQQPQVIIKDINEPKE